MKYQIKAASVSKQDAALQIKDSKIAFGTTSEDLPNPAELFLGSFAACILKNVERFSTLMRFSYTKAEIEVNASRLEGPPRMDDINYTLTIQTEDEKLNVPLLQKNIEKFGTIFNTIKLSATVSGTINVINV